MTRRLETGSLPNEALKPPRIFSLRPDEFERRISGSLILSSIGTPVLHRSSQGISTITVRDRHHIQYSTRPTPIAQPATSSTSDLASAASEDRRVIAEMGTTSVTATRQPGFLGLETLSNSNPRIFSTSRHSNDSQDDDMFGVLSRLPMSAPMTILETDQDSTVSRTAFPNASTSRSVSVNVGTAPMNTPGLTGGLDEDPSSLSGWAISDTKTAPDSFQHMTSRPEKNRSLTFLDKQLDGDGKSEAASAQDTAETRTMRPSTFDWASPQPAHPSNTHPSVLEYPTRLDVPISETWKAIPASHPQPLSTLPTEAKQLSTLQSWSRTSMYDSGQQVNEMSGNHADLTSLPHSHDRSEAPVSQHESTASLSPAQDIHRPQEPSHSSRISSSMGPYETSTDTLSGGLTDHLTSSMTLSGSDDLARTTIRSTKATATTSVRADSVLDHIRRAQAIPHRSLGMSVGAAVGGTVIFLLIFALHRPVYRWVRGRRTGVIWIGHAPISSRDRHIELSQHKRNPEMSHFSDES